MEEKKLYNLTIRYYIDLLRAGTDTQLIKEINDFLSDKVHTNIDNFDMQLFQFYKDLYVLQCKLHEQNLREVVSFKFDAKKQAFCLSKIERLRKSIKNKLDKGNKKESDPYKSFLSWLFMLKKYYGSDHDLDSDLVSLIVATEQMMKFYAAQDKQLQKNKAK